MSLFETLRNTGLPVAYGRFKSAKSPPYIIYLGNGQNEFFADDGIFYKDNQYQVEYYYEEKDEAAERKIEEALTAAGYLYTKSEDIYVQSEDMFVIYYYI